MAGCPTCTGPTRETVGLVCQTCGRDYGDPAPWTGPALDGVDAAESLPDDDPDGDLVLPVRPTEVRTLRGHLVRRDDTLPPLILTGTPFEEDPPCPQR